MSRSPNRVLGTFSLAMLTMAAIVSLRNLSLNAGLGISAVFFLCLAGVIFFIPTALVVAELAATWPRPGGCYVWVAEAFGKPLAFLSLWATWMASIAWFPTILVFTAVMLAHMLAPVLPNLEHSQSFILICMLVVFWGFTFLNFLGIEFSSFLSSGGVLIGTIIPGILIIVLGIWWAYAGNHTHIPLSIPDLIPEFTMDNLTLFAGVLLGLAGIELAAYHVREAKDPQRSYPRAILIASAAILSIYILGTLAIAIVVPQNELSIASGMIQAFAVFFSHVGSVWMIPLLAAFLLLGSLASVNAWVAGPAKGMLMLAQDGFLPPWLHKVNKHGVPTALLVIQAIVGSILSILFIYMSSNTSIWLLTALSAQFTCLVYVLIFCAAIKLRFSQPHVVRPFKVKGMLPIAGCGTAACMFSFVIVYIPNTQFVAIESTLFYYLLTASFLLLLAPTLIFIKYRHRSSK
ncbi:MAG TPA: APC family permease [Gammaproteobacteria bacterium]|nr:APC family permease [Gammaproteobacteria bacterium]